MILRQVHASGRILPVAIAVPDTRECAAAFVFANARGLRPGCDHP
jgi:hypothetical protein